MIERSFLDHQSVHAPHSGRKFRILDTQFDIDRKLAGVAVRAQVIGPRNSYLAYRRENRLEAQLPVMSLLAARTSHAALVGSGGWKLQQFRQCRRSGLMHGRTHSQFDGFQVETSRFATTGEDDAQQLLYFARDFLANRLGRFFSCGERVSSAGRARQIFSFTSSNS